MRDKGCEMRIRGEGEFGEMLVKAALAEKSGGEDGESASEPGRERGKMNVE